MIHTTNCELDAVEEQASERKKKTTFSLRADSTRFNVVDYTFIFFLDGGGCGGVPRSFVLRDSTSDHDRAQTPAKEHESIISIANIHGGIKFQHSTKQAREKHVRSRTRTMSPTERIEESKRK